MKRTLFTIFKLSLVLLIGWYLWRTFPSIDFGKFLVLRSRLGWVALAQVFLVLMILFSTWRWQLLLRVQGIKYGFREALSLAFVGYFFNQFVPGPTGGDLVKAFYVARDHPDRRSAGVTAVFLDRVVGVLVLVALSGMAMAFNWGMIKGDPILRHLAWIVAATLAGCAIASGLFFSKRVRRLPVVRLLGRLRRKDLLEKIHGAIYVYKSCPGSVLLVLLASLAAQLSNVLMTVAFAVALGGEVQAGSFLFVVPLSALAMAIPIGTPGGLGQMESAYQILLARVGYPSGLLLALLVRASWLLWSLVGGLIYLTRRDRARQALEPTPSIWSQTGEPVGVGRTITSEA